MPPSNNPATNLDRRFILTLLAAAAANALPTPLRAAVDPEWTTPLPPFRIAGNLHYVGSRDLASYLITTPRGHILINSNLTTSPAQIRLSVEKLGFLMPQIKILLISHAHYDHCAGSSELLKLTAGTHAPAAYMVMDADVPVVESGGKADFQYGRRPEFLFPATKVNRTLHDGEQVTLADTTLTAHKTAGHTQGCTTWTMTAQEAGKPLNVVIVGGPYVPPRYNLIDDPLYPDMAADFAQGFRTLSSLPCDIFLGAHGQYFDLLAKFGRKQAGDASAFVDPDGYRSFVAGRQKDFEAELARQKLARRSRNSPNTIANVPHVDMFGFFSRICFSQKGKTCAICDK